MNYKYKKIQGLTLIELIISMSIISILAAIAIPSFFSYMNKTQITRVNAEIRMLEKEILYFDLINHHLPNSLDDIGYSGLSDPWGNPYRYTRIDGGSTPKGKWRKDRFLVPVNTDFDLYSMGKDGKSRSPFTAKHSRDDIVRANNGGYIGLAADY